LFDASGLKSGDFSFAGPNIHFDGIAAHLAVFDIDLMRDAEIEDEGNLLPAVGTGKEIFFGHGLG
jgi:hypothetical protein